MPAEDSTDVRKNNRKLRNFLIEPGIQLRYGLYFSISAVIFAGILGYYFYFRMNEVLDFVIQLTDVPAATHELVKSKFMETITYAVILLMGFAVCCFVAGVFLTHRLVGPMVAFRRHVRVLREGDSNYRTTLREGDDFYGFAGELNALSETFGKSQDGKP